MKKYLFLIATIFFLQLPRLSVAQNEYNIMGMMHHSDLEGGCWYLQVKQMKYELTASPAILQTCYIEGRQLTLRVRPTRNIASICMLGRMVEVVEILDSVMHPHNPPVFNKKIKGTVRKTNSGCWYVMATDKKHYELQAPVPKQFMRIGAKYNRMSKVEPGSESQCENMDGVITISMLEPDMMKKEAKEKKYDPR